MNEAILDKKIKTWEDQLLDLGKRNKMISFRESKRSTLKILKPGFDELYQQIVVDEKELTFQKAIDRDSDVRVYSILTLMEKLSYPMEVNIGDIRAEGTLPEIKKTLKHLRSKARLSMDEQGTNILYLVFGFIEWHEKGSRNDSWVTSPLILVPVTLTLPSLNAQYTLKKHEDEIVVNPTLAYLFERDYGITLPDFDSDRDTLESFMQKMEELVDERGWRIVRECSMGLVSFLKISMYNDLIRNEAQLKTNPIIRAFAGERNEINTISGDSYEFDHDACRSVDSFQVLNADSSQQDAIALSQKGVSFVMQGPPGTGKSQTITNIIAQALADGKKVLFVSEKMAALDVVYRRLTDVNLADFCLSLHSHKANKNEILNQLGANLDLQLKKVKDEELAKLTRLDMIREQLKAYVNDIHQTIMPLEMSLYEVYGAILALGSLPDIEIHLADVDKLTKDDVNRMALLVANLDKAQEVLGAQWYKNPWQGITCPYLEVSQKRELQEKLQDGARIISALEECQLVEKTLADLLTVESFDSFFELYSHACNCNGVPNDWFYRSTEQEERLIRTIRDKKQTVDNLTDAISGRYSPEFFALSAHSLRTLLPAAIKNYCRILRNNTQEDTAFMLMEDDLQQVLLLEETCRLLVDALDVLSAEYKLCLNYDFSSVEDALMICEMLLHNRKLTGWYFSDANTEHLLQYVSELQKKLSAFVEQKEHLCRRYHESILEYENAELLLEQTVDVENRLCAMVSLPSPEYVVFCSIAAFDTEKLHHIEHALNNRIMSEVVNTYGLTFPDTLSEINTQISAIEKIRCLDVVHSWKSATARNKAKQLLKDVIKQSLKLEESKAKLEAFFSKFGITLDISSLSTGDVDKLKRVNGTIHVPNALIAACNCDAAYCALDTIEEKTTEYIDLGSQIQTMRAEYRINDELSNSDLLDVLRDVCGHIAYIAPCEAWATEKTKAYTLIKWLTSLSDKIRTQRRQLMETYEESVFTLDYEAMLNRFKVEYTSIFKVFKSSYKEDVKQIRLVFKEVRKKVTDDEIIALLQELKQYHRDLSQYRSYSPMVSKFLNIQEYDIDFDWEGVKKRLEDFDAVAEICADDAATYLFITEKRWERIYAALQTCEELGRWFDNNEEARKCFADLYTGLETDTAYIRSLMHHARDACELFVTPEHYISYMLGSKETQLIKNAQQHASTIINIRNWFAERLAEIELYSGVAYTEQINEWETILANLEIFEEVATTLGETAAYALAANYRRDGASIDKYAKLLVGLTNISEYANDVYYATRQKHISKISIRQMLADIYSIIADAQKVQAVYAALSVYAPEAFSALSLNEIKADLGGVVLYQNTRDDLTEIEEDARTKIGESFMGVSTDWDEVRSNIDFSDKIRKILSGNISQELINAFVSGTAMYSGMQLSEMQRLLVMARKIDSTYPGLIGYKELNVKIQILAELIDVLESAIKIKNDITGAAYVECSYSDIMDDLYKLAQLQEANTVFDEAFAKAQESIPAFAFAQDTDWDKMVEKFTHLKQIKRAINSSTFDPEIIQFVTNAIPGISTALYAKQIEKFASHKRIITAVTSMFETKSMLEGYTLTKLARRIRNCNEQFSTLDAWIDLRDCKKACVDSGLEKFINAAEDTYYPAGRLNDVFLKSFYYEWFEVVCAGIESVSGFRVRTQESRVSSFRELDAHQLPVDQMRIRERLIRNMPNRRNFDRATDEMSILLHELNKKRNIMPLRKLFRSIPNLLLKLKPCLMMSPLSVAYFLEAETYRFDMVIFDEASQIFPQDAIGAIFRAKQVVIAGDSKQLPPTNFFAASTSNDNDFDVDDDEYEELNFDSILEEASNSLINRSLLWHYRSRFEELISFSNRQIYQNNLITFPSSTVHKEDTGVEYVYVKNGVYENRTNRAEALEIVRLVAEHIKNYPNRSLGIIAFSESQQSVIEEEINKFRTRNPRYEKFFDEDKDEPFFIKNLENVQGDERDTIIFSICYAKNAQGRMYMRFGPLGHQGGERRLNVAITRAKHNIKLVGSILPEDIDLSKTHSEGVRMLRSYISFAMHGSSALIKPERKKNLYDVDTFAEQVGKFLISRGCTVHMNVGSSDYTIDIAVEHPKKPGQYIAGIECDGSSYYMARTVRDREHLRTVVLEQMGWKMYRVWSTEWIRNPEAEKERLMAFIQDALLHHGETVATIHSNEATEKLVETEIVKSPKPSKKQDANNPYNLPLYKEGNWWDKSTRHGRDNLSNVADMIHAVVKVEQPIHMELLYKRVGQGFTAGKATQAVRATIDQAINERMRHEVVIEDQFVRLRNQATIQPRRSPIGVPDRNIEHISIPEIAAVMEKVLVGAYGMDRSVLCAEAAKVFGFERSGPKIKQRTNEAVDYLVRTNKVSDYDNKIQLLED